MNNKIHGATSKDLFEEAKKLFPGGVNSPVRLSHPYPRFIEEGKDGYLYDVEGKKYIDLSMGFGAIILGHSRREVITKISNRLYRGITPSTSSMEEIEMANLIKKHFYIESMRFVNSGSEATMHAIRLARAYTKREKILMLNGSYHGSHDQVMMKLSGKDVVPWSDGILNIHKNFANIVEFNDIDAVEKELKKEDKAAFMLEPVMGNAGVILPDDNYLKEVRTLTERYGTLLIFDEVITGLRVSIGGASAYYRIKPDLITMGKVAGGGLPLGIFGGKAEIMGMVAPAGNVYEGCTFAGNPLTMSAGIATLKVLEQMDYSDLYKKSKRISEFIVKKGYTSNFHTGMVSIFFTDKPVRNYSDAQMVDRDRFRKFAQYCLDNGVYLPESPYESWFPSFSHTEEDIEELLAIFDGAL